MGVRRGSAGGGEDSAQRRSRIDRLADPPSRDGHASTRPVGVLVADKFPVIRRGIAAAVRRRWDLELVGEAGEGAEAVGLIRRLQPDVALVEVDLAVFDGLELTSTVLSERLSTRVVMFGSDADGRVVQRAIVAGAAGYITKYEAIDGICEAIRRVGAGETYLSDEAREALWVHLRTHEPIPRLDLTPREIEILRLTAAGATSAAIGAALHLSASTVKNHLRHLYDKLGVSTAAAAVHRAMREGVLE